MKQLLVTISGIVQGVSFRYFLQEQAQLNNVTGWTKNTDRGTVEALFQGDEKDVGKMVKRCLYGPEAASVESIEIKDADESICNDFVIKR